MLIKQRYFENPILSSFRSWIVSWTILCFFVLSMILSSCEGACVCGWPLVPSDGYGCFEVKPDWSGFPQEKPTGWTLMVYNTETGTASRYISAEIKYIQCRETPGDYIAIAFNQTTHEFGHIDFDLSQTGKCKAFGFRYDAPIWAKEESEIFIEEPDWLCAGKIDIGQIDAKNAKTQDCPCSDHPLEECCCPDPDKCSCCKNTSIEEAIYGMDLECCVELVRIDIECEWADRIKQAIASLNGLAEGFSFDHLDNFGRVAQITDQWNISRKEEDGKGFLKSEFKTFGFAAAASETGSRWGELKLLVANEANKVYSCRFDVDETNTVWDKKAHTIDIKLFLKGELPFDGGGGGGWTVGVGDWGPEKEIELY